MRTSLICASVFAGLFSACAIAAPTVSCDPAQIGAPVASAMGLRYEGKYPAPLAAILSQGEAERLKAAGVDYNALSGSVRRAVKKEWRQSLKQLFDGSLPDTFTGGADEPSFDFLRAAAPLMLARLKSCGPAADSRLAYLSDIDLNSTSVPGGEE